MDWNPRTDRRAYDMDRVCLWLGGEWQEPRIARWFAPWGLWLEPGTEPENPNDADEVYGIGDNLWTHWSEIEAPA